MTEHSLTSTAIDHGTTTPTVVGTWTCVELDYTFPQAVAGRIQLFIGDSLALDQPAADTAPTYDQAWIGIARADAAGSEVIVDDIALGYEHIGCN